MRIAHSHIASTEGLSGEKKEFRGRRREEWRVWGGGTRACSAVRRGGRGTPSCLSGLERSGKERERRRVKLMERRTEMSLRGLFPVLQISR